MTHTIIVGSGPAAAGVALALSGEPDQEITVLDLGGTLEPENRAALTRLKALDWSAWTEEDLDLIRAQPIAQARGELPQKRSYGSDYPFRDLGQLMGVSSAPGGNQSVISSAYGGFSNVWGAQTMPFSRSTFDRWPIAWKEIEPHYREVLREVPLAAEPDDLEDLFPLLSDARRLPPPAPRTVAVLQRYGRHRDALKRQGVLVGRARLAFQSRDCVRCGLCMTGCPYSLIYSAAQTFDRLRATGRVRYHDRIFVKRIGQRNDRPFACVQDVASGRFHEFTADRIFIACGGLGTTRLMLGSMSTPPATIEMGESVQFMVPFLSRNPVADPRGAGRSEFTLNQFNILLDFDGHGYNTSQVHCYLYNPAFLEAMPAALKSRAAAQITSNVLRRTTVGLGYLPSWASPRIRVRHHRATGQELPQIEISAVGSERPAMYGRVLRRLMRAAPKLDLWPVLLHSRIAGAAKSYHFGGSFPHARAASDGPGPVTDRLGRIPEWDRIHLVDGSVFPSVPSTTFTLTVMANAHRIATEALTGSGAAG